MSQLENLTVAITNFHRPQYLDRALNSVREAGVRRVVVAAVEPDDGVLAVLKKHNHDWLSFDVATVRGDIGCNDTWMLAAYHCRTERIIILHDDDLLNPQFGETYEEFIGPALDRGAGFASWRSSLYYDDGHTALCDYFRGATQTYPSSTLLPVVGQRQRLSLSPIVSVLNRTTVIRACKEAKLTLSSNASLQHPGMLLGTEIVVYLRHIQKFQRWFFMDRICSHYGATESSGTIKAEKSGDLSELWRGYDLARDQCDRGEPQPTPRLIFVYSSYEISDPAGASRAAVARASWDFHFDQMDMIEFPVRDNELPRSSAELGDPRPVPYIRDILDYGCARATPGDVVVYSNQDIGLTTLTPERLLAGVARGQGVTVCIRRTLIPRPGRFYKSVLNCKADGGFDVVAVTPSWWRMMRDEMPDMLIGREAWDGCFRTLAEEWADNRAIVKNIGLVQDASSRAYTDDVCYHHDHPSFWQQARKENPGQLHNRKLARDFFEARGNHQFAALLAQK